MKIIRTEIYYKIGHFLTGHEFHKWVGYCWPTSFKVPGGLFLREVSSVFCLQRRHVGPANFGTWGLANSIHPFYETKFLVAKREYVRHLKASAKYATTASPATTNVYLNLSPQDVICEFRENLITVKERRLM
jgi:hypothetical protein